MEWEVSVIEWIQTHLGFLASVPAKILSFLGGEMGLLIVVLIVMFCWKKEVGMRLALIVATVNAWLPMLKSAVLRLRPYMQHPGRVEAKALVDSKAPANDIAAQGYSFPSAHAASTAALYPAIAKETKKKWMYVVAIIVVLLVGLSRVATGMHYPTDVLAGWGMGLVGMAIIYLFERFIKKDWIRHLILFVSVLPGLFFVRTNDYFTSLGLMIGAISAYYFDKKFVRFEDTRNVFAMILRVVLAFGVYFALNTLLKLPFSSDFLNSGELPGLLVRTARYSIVVFVMLGVYPKVFPLFEKIGKKKAK